MLGFAIRRIATLVPTLFVIITLSFLIIRLAPGGPFDEEQALPPAIRANLDAAYGLDQPLATQYVRYLGGLVHGDFGPSFKFRDTQRRRADRAGAAREPHARCCARCCWRCCSACRSARSPHCVGTRAVDHGIRGIAALGIALPSFVIGPLLALVFGLYLHWLPVAGWARGRAAVSGACR